MNWYYLSGLAVGALIGTFLIGSGLSWALQTCFRVMPARKADAWAMGIVAVGAVLTNGNSNGLPTALTIAIYGIAAGASFLALSALRPKHFETSTTLAVLPDGENYLFQELTPTRRRTPGERTHTVFHRVGTVAAAIALIGGFGVGLMAGTASAWQFILGGAVAAFAFYVLSRAIGWIIAGAMPE